MERFFKRNSNTVESSLSINQPIQPAPHKQVIVEEVEVNIENIPSNPILRPNIMSYPLDIRNQVRRAYLLKGPCQSRHHKFPQRVDGTRKQRFITSWFDEFNRNFLELLKVLASCNEEINKTVLKNAPDNLKLTSPDIQKDIIDVAAIETTKAIITDLRDDLFSILQMGVVIRYVNGSECVIERFIGLVHVYNTSAASLKKGIESLLSTYGLSISSLRGQGYDGASICEENSSAYYIHCFAHQLQLTLVAVAKKHSSIGSFFNTVTHLVNVIGGSCKRRDMLQEKQLEKVFKGTAKGEIKTGQGLNQETALKRSGDTHWSSHYGTLINLIYLFPSIIDVLVYIGENGNDDPQRAEAIDLLDIMNRFEFVFVLHLMKKILGITHELSQVLQRRDQDIVNAMNLVKVSKCHLQVIRENGWESLLLEFQELNNRFDEVNTNLLLCMACLDPKDSFSAFNTSKLIQLVKFYPCEFSPVALIELESQLENFVFDMRMDKKFSEVSGIRGLVEKMIITKKHIVFPLVYLLIKLSLILPVATATMERAFSAMNIIKSSLRNRMGDELLNNCLVTYIERDVFASIDNEVIMDRFQSMKNRR
ncbi:hypothetical protein P3X46_033639 [Hevea brasiliensis]|uniref:HAT C-terminal dimerisation domain-containing protein n=2 Tax=Hevea brasiliensis TaxID=3981 RepID=A0ABQ9KBW7_HEVBR|nr:hypothetical protein P3X46_033639 [Hevea brasiliensis]